VRRNDSSDVDAKCEVMSKEELQINRRRLGFTVGGTSEEGGASPPAAPMMKVVGVLGEGQFGFVSAVRLLQFGSGKERRDSVLSPEQKQHKKAQHKKAQKQKRRSTIKGKGAITACLPIGGKPKLPAGGADGEDGGDEDPDCAFDVDDEDGDTATVFGLLLAKKGKANGKVVVAVKELRKRHVVKTGKQRAVVRERDIHGLASGHPFIVALLGTYTTADTLALVMELLPAGDLFDLQSHCKYSQLPWRSIRFYSAAMLLALDFLHSRSPCVLFRDLKPENILLNSDGYPRLSDFGFATTTTSGVLIEPLRFDYRAVALRL
jgi:serine/threonine protein kinase